MKINISTGTGLGPTQIAAFDQALVNAGVANFNLIYLSSVLPPNSQVITSEHRENPKGDWGDKLYVVMAQQRTAQRNQEAWAGIGWIQDPKTKKGLLVEHEGHTEDEVTQDIHESLLALARNRGMEFGPIHFRTAGTKCTDLPVCALVVAVFESASWQTNKSLSKALPFR